MASDFALLVEGIRGSIAIVRGLKSAYDQHAIVQVQTEILEKLLALQIDALSLQEDHFALLRSKRELEETLVKHQQWDDTAAQYSLKNLESGAYVYAPNESNKSPEPMHWICAKCYGDRKKSLLHFVWDSARGHHAFCQECHNWVSAERKEMLGNN